MLLILAGITINMVLKDNGIIEKSKEAEQPSLTERGTLDIIVRETRGEVQEQKSAQIKINELN